MSLSLCVLLSPGHAKRAALFKSWGGFYTLSDIWAMSLEEKLRLVNDRYAGFTTASLLFFIIPSLLFVLNCSYFKSKKLWGIGVLLCVIAISVVVKNHKRFLSDFKENYGGLLYFSVLFVLLLAAVWFYRREHNESMKRLFIKILLLFVLFCVFVGTTIQVGIPDRAGLMFILITAIMVAFVYQHWSAMNESGAKKCNKWIFALLYGYGLFVLSV